MERLSLQFNWPIPWLYEFAKEKCRVAHLILEVADVPGVRAGREALSHAGHTEGFSLKYWSHTVRRHQRHAAVHWANWLGSEKGD